MSKTQEIHAGYRYDGRNRTFFFVSYETTRGSPGLTLFNTTVPLAPWRQGNFSSVSTVIQDPFGNTPFPGNQIPASAINPVSQKIQDLFYPLPNYGNTSVLQSGNYRENVPWVSNPKYWVVRTDHRFSERDSIYGRLSNFHGHNNQPLGSLSTMGPGVEDRPDHDLTTSWTHIFSATLLNEFRYGFGSDNFPESGPQNGNTVDQELGLVGLAPNLPNVPGVLNVSWSGIALTGITQTAWIGISQCVTQEFQDRVSWFRGRHSMKMGFNLSRALESSQQANNNLFGSVSFSNRFTGFPYADFLLGIPTSAARAFPPVRVDYLRWQYDLFFEDDIKWTPKLTLNLGLRYEYHPPWVEQHGSNSVFDIGNGKIVIPDGSMNLVSQFMPTTYVGVVEASSVGLPAALVRSDKDNFAPRVGIAYTPWSARTVFRAGFGVYYDVIPRPTTYGSVPFVVYEPSYTNPVTNPNVIFPRVFPATSTGAPSTVGLPSAVNPNLRMPYSMQWNFTIEHTRWGTGFRLSYIATDTRQAYWNYNYNSPAPNSPPFVNKPRPLPSYPPIGYITNGATHNYNGMTTEVKRYLAKGLQYQFSWTWARDIGGFSTGGSTTTANPEDSYDFQRERGVTMDMPTHRVAINWIYGSYPKSVIADKHFCLNEL